MRISNIMINDSVRGSMYDNRNNYLEKQLQISTGRKNLNRSDNPTDTSLEARVEQYKKKNEQWVRNINDAYDFTQFTDSKVGQIKDTLQRVNELVVGVNNGTQPPGYRKDVALEIDKAIEALVQYANSDAAGIYLFGGTGTAQNPFTPVRDPVTNEITSVTYNGSTTQRSIQTGESMAIDRSYYGIIGQNPADETGLFVYNDLRAMPPADHPTWTPPANTRRQPMDIFQNLIEIRDDLQNGDIPQDVNNAGVCHTPLADLQYNLDHVIDKYVETGAQAKQFKSMATDMGNMELVYKSQISELGDTDVALAATELAQLQASYQASLQIAVKVNSMSLMDYI